MLTVSHSMVSIVRAAADARESVARALSLCGADDIVDPGATVVVKPNLHGSEGTTSPPVMQAACEWAFERGAGRVLIGDGPYYGLADAAGHLRSKGLGAVCEATGAEMVSFHDMAYVLIRPHSPHAPPEIGIAAAVHECDCLINLPLMKTHFNTLVTLGLKNLKGVLRPQDKRRFHQMELNRAVVQLNRLVRPSVTLLDAIRPMEGLGPAAGPRLDLGLLLASKDTVALDAVASAVMGIEPHEVMLTRLCADAGLGTCDLAEINIIGERLEAVQRRFRRPHEELAARWPGLQVLTAGACSGCTMNLFNALAACTQELEGVVVTGSDDPPPDALLVGDCTRRKRQGQPLVSGCPPSEADIAEALAELAGTA